MHEHHEDRVHPEPIVLDIGEDVGALIIYTDPGLRGQEFEVSRSDKPEKRTHVAVLERIVGTETVFAAAYPELKEGEYRIWEAPSGTQDQVSIRGGEVTTVDWRRAGR